MRWTGTVITWTIIFYLVALLAQTIAERLGNPRIGKKDSMIFGDSILYIFCSAVIIFVVVIVVDRFRKEV